MMKRKNPKAHCVQIAGQVYYIVAWHCSDARAQVEARFPGIKLRGSDIWPSGLYGKNPPVDRVIV